MRILLRSLILPGVGRAVLLSGGGRPANADGVVLDASALFLPGFATGAALVEGVTFDVFAELVAGGATRGALASGVVFNTSVEFLPGTATGDAPVAQRRQSYYYEPVKERFKPATVQGVLLHTQGILIPGVATGAAFITPAEQDWPLIDFYRPRWSPAHVALIRAEDEALLLGSLLWN